MKKLFVSTGHFKRPFISALLLVLLVITLTAWGSGGFGLARTGSGEANAANTSTSMPAWTGFGPQPCPDAVANPTHWNPIVGVHGGQKVESVRCSNLLNNPSQQALVTVRNPGSNRLLDVYIYTYITNAHPTQLFKLQGLNRGEAKISKYNTVITAQVDLTSSINKGQPPAKLTKDLFREFRGFDTEGTFVQVVFQGMFPDLTRWQAEADQARVNHGQDTWKLDAVQTAKHFAATFLKTSAATSAILVSGGGRYDLDARVNLAFPSPGGGGPARITKLTLSRLEGNANGIWEVTAVVADWMFISSPQSGLNTCINTPITVTGFGPQFEAQIGVVWVLDHLYNKIGQAFAMAPGGNSPPSNFTVTFPYTSSFHAGAQEGIIELLHVGGASFDFGAVMVKVLVNP
jgi:hypothetical protein